MRIWLTLAAFGLSVGLSTSAQAEVQARTADMSVVREDLSRILKAADLQPDRIEFSRELQAKEKVNEAIVSCPAPARMHITVHASDAEWSSTFYHVLQKFGFLFPHPRIQISPRQEKLSSFCGRTFVWDPRLEFRGFHLHTQHPNEWVHGFLMGQKELAFDEIRWLARNGQNLLNVVLLAGSPSEMAARLAEPFSLARSFGILTGIDLSFSSQQQKAYRLVDTTFPELVLGLFSERQNKKIHDGIVELARLIPYDFMVIELGSSEFTSTGEKRTLRWIDAAAHASQEVQRQLFFKIHVSVNQMSKRFGNFNFLPRFAPSFVGILPHTVMDYALGDARAPVYGRRDFSDMRELMLSENGKRPVWYFPETSYFVAMDIDVPLFLTDYLLARSRDMDDLEDHGIRGQIDFTTGQELGYWLMDWTVALLTNREYRGKPLIGLELLGENLPAWQRIVDFQHKYIQEAGLLGVLSSSTLLDEIPFVGHSVHERILLRDLRNRPEELKRQIALLEKAVAAIPPLADLRNFELWTYLQLTFNRIRHALHLRKALLSPSSSSPERAVELKLAEAVRVESLHLMFWAVLNYQRYPEAVVFSTQSNPTSYPFGYGWTAANLHYWEREERMIREGNYSPLFMNIYDPFRILF